jgi:hypothetical protein
MSPEQPAPQEGTFDGVKDYEALRADSARRGEPKTYEDHPARAEHMGHAMNPHMEDAILLETMSENALTESQKAKPEIGMGAKQLAFLEKTNKLGDAASASRFAADEAANEVKTAYDEAAVARQERDERDDN